MGHRVPTPDLESGDIVGLGTGNVKMNKPGASLVLTAWCLQRSQPR